MPSVITLNTTTNRKIHAETCMATLVVRFFLDYPDTWRKMDTTVLAAFLEYSLNPTWLADSDGRCIYANRELRGIAALSAAQLEDLNWLDLYRKRTDKCLPLYGRKREFIVSPIGLDSFFVPRDSERGIAVDAVGTGHIAPDGSEV
jgi:PAS domain-containing protein